MLHKGCISKAKAKKIERNAIRYATCIRSLEQTHKILIRLEWNDAGKERQMLKLSTLKGIAHKAYYGKCYV